MKYLSKKFKQKNRGAAMIIVVMFFVVIGSVILIGVISPTIRGYLLVRDSLQSKRSYFLAESGVEDVLYRIKNGLKRENYEELELDGNNAETSITNITSDKKEIVSVGNTSGVERTVKITANTGIGVSFSYGVLSGVGGFTMDNNSKIIGSVYSNGSIIGTGEITGTATSANSNALTPDQTNGTGTPLYDIKFGNTYAMQDHVQSFKVSNTVSVNKIKLYIKKIGTPSDITVRIVTNYAPGVDAPSLTTLTSSTLSASAISTNYGWVEVPFSAAVSLTGETPYWIVLDTVNPSISNYYYAAANKDVYLGGFGKTGEYGIYNWNKSIVEGQDIYFDLYSVASTSVLANGVSIPDYDIKIGTTNATQDFTEGFQVSNAGVVSKVQLYLKKVGTPANITVRITNTTGDAPYWESLTSATLSASTVSTNYGWVDVPFSKYVQLVPGVNYWLVLDTATTGSSKYYVLGANANGYLNGYGKIGEYQGQWSKSAVAGKDLFFNLFMGGLKGLISGVKIGTASLGNAYSHEVKNATISGTNYCQIGTGNNKSCNTSIADPGQIAMPISEQNILDWKTQAEAGGTITGTYTIPGSMSLGPKKITGNLILENNKTLTLTGPLWVEGSIYISNNATVKLDPSFGDSSGVMIADNNVYIYNNGVFNGSGTTGSYILVISTSSQDQAIQLGNNAGAVALYAANGKITVANNGGAKSVNGYAIHLNNNAVLQYDSGLTDLNFDSGPAGSWNIEGWKEVE